MLPPSADRPFNPQGKVMVSDMATAVDRWIGMGTSKQAESRVVETSITASELAAAIASARIRIVVPGKFNTAVKLPNMAKAAEALRACEDDLAKRWKIARNWVTDPKLIPDSRGPFRHSDYPQNLVAANRSGSVLVLLAVYSIGRVSDCRIIDRDISIPEIIRPWRIDRFKPILRPSSRGSWRWFCVF
ncbi:MAG: hypothetical protein LH610_08610 [Sphingomonas bacterium]|nr:hypothetical protein [Sphingomonas bacterium]